MAKDKKNDIAIFTPKKLFKKVDRSLHHSNIKGVKVYAYSAVNIPFLSSEWPIPITPMFLINLIRVFWRYEIIHIWTYFYISTVTALWVRRLLFWRKKTILTMDTIPGYSFEMPGKIVNGAMKAYGKIWGWLLFRLPDKITLYGNSLKKYAKMVNMPLKKIEVIPTGIEISKFQGKYKDIRKEFGIKKDETIILFVGLVVPRKGVDIVIDVIEKLKDEKIRMVIVGDGPNRRRYEKEAKKRGLKDKFIFTGWRKDVKDFYRSADIFFFPSKGEGLAGVIMEAMASGLPVISSKIPCTIDLIEERKSGFLVPLENNSKYIGITKYLNKRPGLRKEISIESKKQITKFSWKKMIIDYTKLYRRFENND